ncbi:MAG: alcohol dehydrogenase catalytic domain-containing protein [Deltaproteobacteria bacterium]|nr:alcohol dehydrogenase catalytic domain-containing protein [Deltaproteobacteria bacterium]
MKMKAAVLREYKKPLRIEEVELAAPKEHEVLVKTAFTGFCHSDLSFMEGDIPFPLPMVVGHEAAGIVEAVGPGVTALQKGDHVVATWMVACGHCPECTSGRGHICRTSHGIHTQGTLLDGTSRLKDAQGNQILHNNFVSGFAEYMVLVEAGAIKIRDDLPLDQACSLACCMPTGFGAACNVAQVKPGQSVAVWGMGGVGLNVVQGARLRGAYPIFGVDLEGSKEEIARKFGVTHFIDSSKEDPVPIIQLQTGGVKMDNGMIMGGGADIIFEVSGNTGAMVQASWALAMGGKWVQVGIHPADQAAELVLTFFPPHCKTLQGTLYGNIRTHEDIPAFADMIMRGDYKLDNLITRKFKIEEINEVAEAMRQRKIIGRWVCEW